MKDTNIIGSGIQLEGWSLNAFTHQFLNVTVNNKPLGYFVENYGTTINPNDYGQIILVDSHDITIESASIDSIENPFQIIHSSDISVRDVFLSNIDGTAFFIQSSSNIDFIDVTIFDGKQGFQIVRSDSIRVINSSFVINDLGLYIFDSSNVYINGNSIIGGTGIGVMDSADIFMNNNHIASEGTGIFLDYYADVEIVNNRISAGWEGISVSFSAYWEPDLRLVDIIGNPIYQCSTGIRISYSNGINIIGNYIIASWSEGIYLEETFASLICYNEIAFTEEIGILLEGSRQNQIYGNLFHHNDGYHARETGANIWFGPDGFGNCWDDYNGEGGYQIKGNTNSYDSDPLNITDTNYILPLLSSPSDRIVNRTEEQPMLVWVAWIDEPIQYVTYVDSVEFGRGVLNVSGSIHINMSELSQGIHNLSIWIGTETGEVQVDQVTIIIGSLIPSEIMTIATISLVAISVVILEVKRRRDLI
jgi:parallel beta-helix repeat protein